MVIARVAERRDHPFTPGTDVAHPAPPRRPKRDRVPRARRGSTATAV